MRVTITVERDLLDPVVVALEAPAEPSDAFVGPDDAVAAVRREEDRARRLLLRATAQVGRHLVHRDGVRPSMEPGSHPAGHGPAGVHDLPADVDVDVDVEAEDDAQGVAR